MDDGVQEYRSEQADQKSPDVRKVVDSWRKTDRETNHNLDDEADELACRSVLDLPVGEQIPVRCHE